MSVPSVAAPLIGRDRALAALVSAAGVSRPPRAGAVLVVGDAGIGKSRLLTALAEEAGADGWRVGFGHCLDLGGSPVPYLPFRELGARLAALFPEPMKVLVERWPTLRRVVPSDSPDGILGEPVDRGVFFEAVHAAFSELANQSPLLLVVEDLHWADQSTYDLLSYLFTRGFVEPVSIVASYRSDDLHRRHPLRTIAAGWSRLPQVGRIELEALPDSAVEQLVTALHPGPLAEADVRAIIGRAEGNAFFTEELVAAIGTKAMPRDLAGLLLLRVDQLEPEARLVVRAAAAGGRLVRDAVLEAVSGQRREIFGDAVRAAVEQQVLVPDDDGYRFRHSMLAEAVYDDLLPGERRRLHQAYVEVLQATVPPGGSADLARHALGAEAYGVAFGAGVQAGDEALALGGPDEASRHFSVALDLVSNGLVDATGMDPPPDVVGLTEKASAAAAAAGLVQRAVQVVDAQLARLPRSAPDEQRARLLVALAEAAWLAEQSVDLLSLTTEAAELTPAEPPTALRAHVVAAHATVLAAERRDEEAVRWAEDGLAMAPELRPAAVTAQLQTVLAKISERQGDASGSIRLLTRLAEEARAGDDPSEVRILHQLGAVQLERGELADALATYRKGAERTLVQGQPWAPYGVDCRALWGLLSYQLGRWDEAARIVDTEGESPPELAAASLLSVSLAVRAGRGQGEGFERLLERTRPQWPLDGMIGVQSAAAAIDLRGDAGDVDGAIAIHDHLVECIAPVWGTRAFQARIRLAALLVGQLANAAPTEDPGTRPQRLQLAEQLAEVAEHATAMGRRVERGMESEAWLLRLAAEHYRLRWRSGEAVDATAQVEAWRAAVAAFADYGHVFEAARSQARLAAALKAHGDALEAGEVAEAARTVARLLHAGPLLAELDQATGVRNGHSGSIDLGLTPREAEVLALVAEGRSNGQIGTQLFISTKTASVHVSNILAKLDARSRSEAVAMARARGLLT